jgi:hypothetical protein
MSDAREEHEHRVLKWQNIRDYYRHDYRCIFCKNRLLEYHTDYLFCNKGCFRVFSKKDYVDNFLDWG